MESIRSDDTHDIYLHIFEFKLKEKEYNFLYHHIGDRDVLCIDYHFKGTFVMTDDIKKMMRQFLKRLKRKTINLIYSYSIGYMPNISFDSYIMYDLKTGQPIFGPDYHEHKMDFIGIPRGRSLTIKLLIKVKNYGLNEIIW